MDKNLQISIWSIALLLVIIGTSFGNPSTWTQTTDTDFGAGVLRNAVVTGTGVDASVTLASPVFSYKRSSIIDNSSGGDLTD